MQKKYIVLLGILLLCTAMALSCVGKDDVLMAKDGDTVKVHYTGTLEDGTVFDTSDGKEPYEFTVGAGGVIAGFDEAVRGMQVGEKKTVTIPVDKAYGPRLDELIFVVDRSQLSPDLGNVVVGQQLNMQHETAGTIVVIVTEVSETTITIDANHPMAGKDLIFELELVEIL
ncbi:peptidylprolyl isomerase [Chloroflexota bacterium]